MSLSNKLKHFFASYSQEDKALNKALKNVIGFEPDYLPYYVAAVTHRSYKKEEQLHNNERLEFLGDAFIGSIVGEYLFKKYPIQDEGFLTEMRSKIVSRQSLNAIAIRMGLQKLVRYNKYDKLLSRSHIFGNALEALVGAIYLDKGFDQTKKFILKNLLKNYVDIDELEQTEYNFKNKLYSWSQKNNYQIEFNTLSETFQAGRKVFDVGIFVNGFMEIHATGYNKKEASQRAAEKALEEMVANKNYPFQFMEIESLDIEDSISVTTTPEDDLSNHITTEDRSYEDSNNNSLPHKTNVLENLDIPSDDITTSEDSLEKEDNNDIDKPNQ